MTGFKTTRHTVIRKRIDDCDVASTVMLTMPYGASILLTEMLAMSFIRHKRGSFPREPSFASTCSCGETSWGSFRLAQSYSRPTLRTLLNGSHAGAFFFGPLRMTFAMREHAPSYEHGHESTADDAAQEGMSGKPYL